VPLYYEVLIGPKNDPFCFQVIPSNSSEGDLCYKPDYGSQFYDMEDAGALAIELNAKSIVGNVTTSILHGGENFWIVNAYPWYALGVHQCICTNVREGGAAGSELMYPIQYNWTDQMSFIGRERIGIEYIDEIRVLDHWAFGPHHAWSDPETGATIRMWQPYNGLQIFPNGTRSDVIPPADKFLGPPDLCKAGGATFRIKCDDDGYPTGETSEDPQVELGRDGERAEQIVPGDDYRGDSGFSEMSDVLNGWIGEMDVESRPCDSFNVTELRQLQALLYLARDVRLDDIYQTNGDNRRIRYSMQKLENDWAELDKAIESHAHDEAHPIHAMHRDGHCHEAVMWFVHHLTKDVKEVLASSGVEIPLLSPKRHACPADASNGHAKVCKAYEEQVTCASCHSKALKAA